MPHPDFEWSQDDAKVEIRIPLSALNHAKPSDIDVQLKGNDVIAVSVGSTELLQRRLHDDVKIDQFIVENGTHLVIECVKNESEMWPALLRLPLPLTDSRFMSAAELDALLRTEMCRLPRDEAIEAELAAKEGAAADVDPDELLDDAFDEITAADTAAATAGTEEAGEEPTEAVSSGQQAAMNHELELTKKEFEDFEKIIASLKAKAESEDESVTEADREKHRESVRLVEQMVHLSKLVRRLRSKRPTIEVLLQVLHLEIWKGRLNHGAASEFEVEQYADDVERETPAHELMKQGLQCLEESDFEGALHKIRLAAIHHNHPVSTCLLQRLYSQMRVLPKAAYFVFRRALLDDMEPSTNLIVGEFIDKGMPLFPPYMALAVYFYQRAASVGSTHAMLTLANTFQHGALHASPAGEELRRGNSDDDRFLAWLQAAEDRGSPRAYFIRCSLHLTGESGQKKSYALAKHYLDRLKRTEPSILSKAPGLEARLTQLKAEEELKANPPPPKAAVAAAPASGAASNASRSNPSSPTDSMGSRTNSMPSGAGQVATRAPANRLEALERASGGAQSNMDPAGRGGAARSGGMLGKRPGNNKWKSFFEKSTKWAIGLYATYCLLFPARLAIMPQTFAVMQWIVDLFGGQPSRPTGRML